MRTHHQIAVALHLHVVRAIRRRQRASWAERAATTERVCSAGTQNESENDNFDCAKSNEARLKAMEAIRGMGLDIKDPMPN